MGLHRCMSREIEAARVSAFLGCAVLALSLTIGCSIVPIGDDPGRARLDEAIRGEFEKSGLPGMAIALLSGGSVEWIGCYGYADKEAGRKVSHDTVFPIASVSKLVTGAAVMRLAEEGFIDLRADLNHYLPFRARVPGYPDEPITPLMLLSHTAGLDNNWDLYDSLYTLESGGGDSPIQLADYCAGFFLPDGAYYDARKNFSGKRPGQEFRYSNPGYALLGYLAERASGKPLDEYCREGVFGPLGMGSASWFIRGVPEERLAISYSKGKRLPPYSFPTWPDGALRLDIVDLSRFFLSLMEGSVEGRPEVVSRESFALMADTRWNDGKQGLALSASVLSDLWIDTKGRVLGHSGGDYGITAVAFYSPEKKTGAIFLSNGDLAKDLRALSAYRILKALVEVTGA